MGRPRSSTIASRSTSGSTASPKSALLRRTSLPSAARCSGTGSGGRGKRPSGSRFIPATRHPSRSSSAGITTPPAPRTVSSATRKRRRRMLRTSTALSRSTAARWRAVAASSGAISPSAPNPARSSRPSAASVTTCAPPSASRKMPSGPANLRAFHSIGLWLAVRTMPPAARWCSTASCAVGVVTSPRSITSQPTDMRPADAARANIGPDVRASRARTTLGCLRIPLPASRIPSLAQIPNAAA